MSRKSGCGLPAGATAQAGVRGAGWAGQVRGTLCLLSAAVTLLFVSGCRQDMHNQPKYRPLRPSTLFADGSSARQPIEGTVARGTLTTDEALFTGKTGGVAVNEFPFAITQADVDRGQERFNIFCAPCHDQTGGGRGMVVQRGYRQPPSFHIARLKQAEHGYIFDVITNGFGVMPDYRTQINARDRWRIIAYLRALQLSQPTVAEPAPGATTPAPGTGPGGPGTQPGQPPAGPATTGGGGH